MMKIKQRGWSIAGWARIAKRGEGLKNISGSENQMYMFRIVKDDDYGRAYDASCNAIAFGEEAEMLATLEEGDAFYFEGFEETRVYNRKNTGEPASFQRIRIESVYIPRDRKPDWNGIEDFDGEDSIFVDFENENSNADPFA